MKLVFIIGICFTFSEQSLSQKRDFCQIIEAILNFEPAKKMYYFDRPYTKSIILYDTSKNFNDCLIEKKYNKDVRISSNLDSGRMESKSNYILSRVIIENKKANIRIYYKTSGAICVFILKKRRNIWHVKELKESYL